MYILNNIKDFSVVNTFPTSWLLLFSKKIFNRFFQLVKSNGLFMVLFFVLLVTVYI